MNKHLTQSGIAPLFVILIFVVIIIGAGTTFFVINNNDTQIDKVDKIGIESLEEYCLEQAAQLPNAPFAYIEREAPSFSSPNPPLAKMIPDDKLYKTKSCTIAFPYENEEAYASVGAVYKIDIREVNNFQENVDQLYTDAILSTNSGWKDINPEDKYSSIFMRENTELNTVEYIETFFGIPYYVKFSVYEK